MSETAPHTLRTRIVEALATGFYLGKLPKAPGTFGTILGLPVAWALTLLGDFGYMIGAVVLIGFSSLVAELYERQTTAHDPGEVVIDEVVGYVVAFTWLPMTWQSFAFAFVIFRFFDILKPPPIRQIDQRVHGGLGTVLDDVAAGLASSVVLQLIYNYTSWLGVKLHAS